MAPSGSSSAAPASNPTSSTSTSTPAAASKSGTTSTASATAPAPTETEDDAAADDVFNQEIWGQNLEDVGKETMQDLIWNGEESYVAQVQETVQIIQDAIVSKDLGLISRQGHFLKGSSATIGLQAVPASCEKLQNLGKGKDEEGSEKISEEEALRRCGVALEELKRNHEKAKARLDAWRAEDD